MHLIERDQSGIGRERGGSARAVLHDVFARIFRSGSAIERFVDPFRDAALPAEESMRDAGCDKIVGFQDEHEKPGAPGELSSQIAMTLNNIPICKGFISRSTA